MLSNSTNQQTNSLSKVTSKYFTPRNSTVNLDFFFSLPKWTRVDPRRRIRRGKDRQSVRSMETRRRRTMMRDAPKRRRQSSFSYASLLVGRSFWSTWRFNNFRFAIVYTCESKKVDSSNMLTGLGWYNCLLFGSFVFACLQLLEQWLLDLFCRIYCINCAALRIFYCKQWFFVILSDSWLVLCW